MDQNGLCVIKKLINKIQNPEWVTLISEKIA